MKFRSLIIIFLALLLIPLALASKSLLQPKNQHPVYLTLKLSQGFWWTITAQPQKWYLNSIKPGTTQYNFLGQPTAKITKVEYYPSSKNGRYVGYETFVHLKLNSKFNSKNKIYYFQRNKLLVGSPLEIEFPSLSLSGTIISLTPDNPPTPHYVTKKITLTKKFSYPWECQAIKVGDTMSDGNQTIFQVTHKSCSPTQAITPDVWGNITANTLLPLSYITIQAKIVVEQVNNQFIFAKEYPLTTNTTLPIITPNYNYSDAIVSSIE